MDLPCRVAAVTGDHRRLSRVLSNQLTQFHEELVAFIVAVRIVVVFEVIDVEKQAA